MFFKSYSEKLWGIPCDALDADFAAQRIKKFSLGQAIKAALGLGRSKHKTLVDQFAYPDRRHRHGVRTHGGARRRASAARSICNMPVGRIVHENTPVTGLELADGRFEPVRPGHFDDAADVDGAGPGRLARGGRKGRGVIAIPQHHPGLFERRRQRTCSRINGSTSIRPNSAWAGVTNFRNWVPELYGDSPNTILALEYWCYDEDALWQETEQNVVEQAEREIRTTGLIGDAQVHGGKVMRIRRCYPVYARGYRQHLDPVVQYVRRFQGLTAIGRYGSFKYNNQDHSILMGLLAAENILENKGHDLWAVNTDTTYQESALITKTGLEYPDRRPTPWKKPLPACMNPLRLAFGLHHANAKRRPE